MATRSIAGAILMILPFSLAARAISEPSCSQMRIDLNLKKKVYLAGEPILVEGEIRNEGDQSVVIDTGLDGQTPHDWGPGDVHVSSLVLALRGPGQAWTEVKPPGRWQGITVGGPTDLESGASIPFAFWASDFFSIAKIGLHAVRITTDRETANRKRALACRGAQPVGDAGFEIVKSTEQELVSALEDRVESALASGRQAQLRALSALQRANSPATIDMFSRILHEARIVGVRSDAVQALADLATAGSLKAMAELENIGCRESRGIEPGITRKLRRIVANAESEEIQRRADLAATLERCEVDSDCDGLPDDWEMDSGLNPDNPDDALEDQDLDGLSSLEEYCEDTDPLNWDTDGDQISDGIEDFIDCWPLDPTETLCLESFLEELRRTIDLI